MVICYACGAENDIGKPTRRDVCQKCGQHLKVCLNCRFYEEKSHHQCLEPQAEWVKEKDAPNFCDYFQAGSRRSEGSKAVDKAAEARKKLDELFGKKS